MSKNKRALFLLLLCIMSIRFNDLNAQDQISFSGGINVGGELYGVSGIDNRRSPYSYAISGRIALSYKGFSVPLTVSFRDAQFSYDYTFNRLGIAPTYKWAKVYLGWNTMNFSQYTLSGRAFYGYGTALSPGILRFAYMKGTIQNPLAIRDTLVNGANLIPSFERDVQGIKIGLEKNKNKFELIYMKINDDENTFTYNETYTKTYGYQVLTPKENVVLGINGSLSLFKKIDLYMNTGMSAFTADASDTLLIKYGEDVPSFAKDIFQANSTSRFSLAGDAGINIRAGGHKLGFKYRRVDPFYTTLASNYFINDVEQYTFQLGLNLFKRKIRWDNQLGLEKNNLTKLRTNTTGRVIINTSLSYVPGDRFSAMLKYTNFQTDSENAILNLNDTLRFVSSTNEYAANFIYTTKGKIRTMSYGFNAYYNTVTDQSEFQQIGDINILSLAYNQGINFVEKQWSVQPGIQYNRYNYSDITQERIGGSMRIAKKLLDKKLSVGLNYNYSHNLYNGLQDGNVQLIALNTAYKLSKKSSINLNSSFRNSQSLVNKSFDEWRAILRYSVNL